MLTQYLILWRERRQWLYDKRLEIAMDLLKTRVNIMRTRAGGTPEYSLVHALSEFYYAVVGARLLFDKEVVSKVNEYTNSVERLVQQKADVSAEEKEAEEERVRVAYMQIVDNLRRVFKIQ